MRIVLIVFSAAVLLTAAVLTALPGSIPASAKADYIKWVDFTPSYAAMKKALDIDVESQGGQSWIALLAYLGAKYGGDFARYKERDLEKFDPAVKNYDYYYKAYSAALSGFVGHYRVEVENELGQREWVQRYGLKAFSPIARGYDYSDFDDFGVSRSYGYKRRHLGHDMMGQTGTPIIAVESGVVEELGWNQYGGWRIGIRSFDGARYYYYAHLRRNRPYAAGLEKGQTVTAGDVIGYMGRTGYSSKENVNNIEETHLHIGLELIFDESQKDGVNQIWIDLYAISKLLRHNRVEVWRDENKEWHRVYGYEEQ
ncbi:hypothetical protein FACS1894217_10360 [Clostridia bacterium]|nr:hypothetical protein FACS1894217_10360 [Clostridia bacterium]